MPILAIEQDDVAEEYYSETVYYTGEELDDIAVNARNSENADATLVAAIEKKVYISETANEDGVITDSHLMTKAEVDDYLVRVNSPTPRDSTYLGADSTTEGTLTISIQVFREENLLFRAYARAKWDAVVTGGTSNPASGMDYFAVTWGSNGAFVKTKQSISGNYKKGSAVSFSRAQSDSYGGYCWQFDELRDILFLSPDWMEEAYCTVELERVNNTLQGKETAMRLTYIHTYQATTGTISFEPGNPSSPLSVELSSTPKSWQIEVDVPGLNY